jgi:serine-type D-Ala-D-Ala carboxypeptidase (penicillin-binding protein 5/6)
MSTVLPYRLVSCLMGLAIAVLFPARCALAETIEVYAPQAILMDAATGAVLFEKDADKQTPPASMAKLMTLELAFRALKDGRLKFEDEYAVSQNAYKKGGDRSGATTMFLPAGSRVRVADLVSGIAVASANDACIVMAEGLSGGTEAQFADEMTAAGKDIGLTASHFANATGLPDPDETMSVRDLAVLAQHLIREYPDYYSYFAQRNFSINNKLLLNKNPLLSQNLGVDGLKTGASAEGGQGIVASAVAEDRRLIVVLNGEKGDSDRTADARKLFEYGTKAFKLATVFEAGEIVSTARVWGGTQFYVPLVSDEPMRIIVPRGSSESGRLKASVVYRGPLKAPVKKGDPVGYLRVETAEGLVSKVPVKAGIDVGRSSVLARGLDSILILGLGWALK